MLKVKVEQSRKFNEPIKLSLSLIRRDGGTQPRANLNHQTVLEYVEDMKNGDIFPPVVVFYDGRDFWLCDGFHRLEAAFGVGLTEIAAIVKQGTRRDAVLYSVGANAKHGLRRTNADKRRAVMRLLEDEEWSGWSDRHIARQCGVSHDLVNRVRKSICQKMTDTNLNNSDESICQKMTDTNLNTKRKVKRGEKVYVQDTTNIGKGKQTESPPAQDEVIPDSEQLNQDIEVTNLEENKSTNQTVDTPKTDEVSNHDDSTIDNEETEVKADSNPKQSQRQRKGKQRLVNPLSIGDKVRVKEHHYFGGQEGIVTQLATPSTVIVAFDNDERDVIKLTELDLPTELSKPILVNESTSKPVKKEIIIKEGLNYKAGEGCRWYVEVSEENYQKLKAYKQKAGAVTIDGALTRFFDQNNNQKPITTDDICLNLSSNLKQFTSERVRFILKAIAQSHYHTLINFVETIK